MSAATGSADLGPVRDAELLHALPALLTIAVGAGVVVWWVHRAAPTPVARIRAAWMGAPGPEPRGRRVLRIGLGALLALDGILMLQPGMPSGFVPARLQSLSGDPIWVGRLAVPSIEVWSRHPVNADVAVLCVELGLAVLVLLGGRGPLARLTLAAVSALSLAGWVIGQQFGGLAAPGASWLSGAPGSALVYSVAGGLLLAPWTWWTGRRAVGLTSRLVAGALLIGAWLQALPWEGGWTANGLGNLFSANATTEQPWPLVHPIIALGSAASAHPGVFNGVLIAVLAAVGVGLWVRPDGAVPVATAVALLGLTWWLGQDFGVLGGTGTDPGTAAVLTLLLVSGYLAARGELAPVAAGDRHARLPGLATGTRLPLGTAITVLGVAAVLSPLLLARALLGPADLSAALLNSGGFQPLSPYPAPDFSLTDQTGRAVRLSGLRGSLTLVTFLDTECSDNCPVIANQLAAADRELGALAARVQIVALDTNPVFHTPRDTATFSTEHGMDQLPNWHFVAGPVPALEAALAGYNVSVQIPADGMLAHSQGIYFIAPDGRAVAYLGDGADPSLTAGYTTLVRDEVRRLLS